MFQYCCCCCTSAHHTTHLLPVGITGVACVLKNKMWIDITKSGYTAALCIFPGMCPSCFRFPFMSWLVLSFRTVRDMFSHFFLQSFSFFPPVVRARCQSRTKNNFVLMSGEWLAGETLGPRLVAHSTRLHHRLVIIIVCVPYTMKIREARSQQSKIILCQRWKSWCVVAFHKISWHQVWCTWSYD